MLTIDGSLGEGGGQILRSALALSMITGTPFRMLKIRARRSKPGLLRQHLTAVQAAAKISAAKLEGAGLGSQNLTFWPEQVRAGEYQFDIGTAGSTTLVLQTVLPALMIGTETSSISLTGGTHNPHAPPVDFLEHAFLPILRRMGPRVELQMERHGFYPAGGGEIRATIEPVEKLQPLEIIERGEISKRLCEATVAKLPEEIAQRELDTIASGLKWPRESFRVRHVADSRSPGNFVTIQIGSEHFCEVFTGFGQRGVRAEAVAAGVLEQAQKYLAGGAPVGEYLADQLLLPFALAGGGSFVTGELTPHAETNIETIGRFLPTQIHADKVQDDPQQIQVSFGSEIP